MLPLKFINPQKHYLVSLDNENAIVTCLDNLYIYQDPERFEVTDANGTTLTEFSNARMFFKGELGTSRIISLNTNYLDISDEEIINLIKE